ncbi:MAG: tetratricopeptide repeat protein, partial [Geminicoccaceae bacterium]
MNGGAFAIEVPQRLPGTRAVIRVCRKWSRRLALGAGLLAGSGTLAGCDDQTAVEQRLENARVLVQQGDTRLAIAELKHALQQAPEDADLRLMLGQLYLGRGDLPYAEKELNRAKALGLESPELMLALGDLWLRQNHEAQLLAGLAPHRGWPEAAQAAALGLRARAYLRLDDPQRARSAYQAILELEPDSIDARIGLVRLAMRA